MRFGWLAAAVAMLAYSAPAEAARFFEFEIRASTPIVSTNALTGVGVPLVVLDTIKLGYDIQDPRGTVAFIPGGAENIGFGRSGDTGSIRGFFPFGGPNFGLTFSLLDVATSGGLANIPFTGSYTFLVCPRSCGTSFVGAVDSFTGRTTDIAPAMLGITYDRLFIGVPEPATWAMMIAGVGMIGGAMRRRKAATHVTYAAA